MAIRAKWHALPLGVRAAVLALLVAMCVFGASFASSEQLLGENAGSQPEHVTVIGVEQLSASDGCGARGTYPAEDVIWKSADPPPGMPAQFVDRDTCDQHSVGDTAVVTRARDSDGSLNIVYLTATSTGSALGIAAGLAGGFGALVVLYYELSERWKRGWRRGSVSERSAEITD